MLQEMKEEITMIRMELVRIKIIMNALMFEEIVRMYGGERDKVEEFWNKNVHGCRMVRRRRCKNASV